MASDLYLATRQFRLWRLTFKSTLVLGLLTGLMIFQARLPGQFACLELQGSSPSSQQRALTVDLKSGAILPDYRSDFLAFGNISPDGKQMAGIQPNKSDPMAVDLIIQRVGGQPQQAQSIVVERSIKTGTPYYNRLSFFSWSPDSHRLVYLWPDKNDVNHLSIVNADGSDKRTVLLASPPRNSNSTDVLGVESWSMDSAYFVLGTRARSEYTIWSAADFSPVKNATSFRNGAWSPQGDQLAAIQNNTNGDLQLLLWSPQKANIIPLALANSQDVVNVRWSPDGRYLALESSQHCAIAESCDLHWNYDLYRSDGTLLVGNISGADFSASSSGPVMAGWSADGQKWIFLQQHTDTTADLMALYVADQHYETLANNVVDSLTDNVFYSTNSPYFRTPRQLGSPTRPWLIVPTQHDGVIKVELMDNNGGHRTTLLDGADKILTASFGAGFRNFQSRDGNFVIVPWMKKGTADEEEVLLTWAHPDGSERHEIGGLQAIDHLQLFYEARLPKWLGYTAKQNNTLSAASHKSCGFTPSIRMPMVEPVQGRL